MLCNRKSSKLHCGECRIEGSRGRGFWGPLFWVSVHNISSFGVWEGEGGKERETERERGGGGEAKLASLYIILQEFPVVVTCQASK